MYLINSNLVESFAVGGFVFLVVVVAILFPLFWPVIRAKAFERETKRLLQWSQEYPNQFSNEPEPLKIISEMQSLRRKLIGDWPKSIKKPWAVICLLRYLEAYPSSEWVISGLALQKILTGEEVPEEVQREITLKL